MGAVGLRSHNSFACRDTPAGTTMARFCGNCGKPLQVGWGFCGHCGTGVVPPRAEIITAPAPQPRYDPGSSAAPPGPVAGAAPAPFIPPPVPPPATPPFSASGSPSNNYAIGPPGGMPAGEFARVRIIGHTDYDLIADPV